MATILDGRVVSQIIKDEIADEVSHIKAAGGKIPHLAAVLVGEDGASKSYVSGKVKACEYVGIRSTVKKFDASISEDQLLETVRDLNNDSDIDGYIVQLPLPGHISPQRITDNIIPQKDVDGFHPVNIGRMVKNLPAYISATPFGVLKLMEHYNIMTEGMNCVIIGRSDIVGTPLSILLSRKANPGNCTVTLCHSKTKDIKAYSREADMIVAALGIPEFLTADMIKEGAVVFDVGITRVPDPSAKRGYVIKGDVKFDEVEPKAGYITPVPGGVGLMTIAALLWNTVQASQKTIYR